MGSFTARRFRMLTISALVFGSVVACDQASSAAGGTLDVRVTGTTQQGMVMRYCELNFEVMNNTKARLHELSLLMLVKGYNPSARGLFPDQGPGVVAATFKDVGPGNPRERESGAEPNVRASYEGDCSNFQGVTIVTVKSCDLEGLDGMQCRANVKIVN